LDVRAMVSEHTQDACGSALPRVIMNIQNNSKDLVEQLNVATQKLASATEKLRRAKYSGSDEAMLSELADEVIRQSHAAMDLSAQLDSSGDETPAAGTSCKASAAQLKRQ